MDTKLPDKQYMKIGEVSRLTSLNSSVLRFWETEFSQLRPLKSRSGQRLYTRENLELILSIRQLLYQEKLTIAGAKSRIAKLAAATELCVADENSYLEMSTLLKEVRQELNELRNLLS
ncbi:MAG: MerR family transcriptional regulator [Deltaproteobacteria bacterium]|nr:MerR family transcriptional regulator [Deltaproteobacteria bacterium]TLN04502.1 MAG: MerR family transcriptional regulator [bacterium]